MDDNGIYSIKTTNIKVGQFPELLFSGNLGVRLSAIPSNRGFSTWHQSPGPMSWPNKKRHLAEVEVHMAYGGHGRPNTKSYEILETPAFTVISNIFEHRSPCCVYAPNLLHLVATLPPQTSELRHVASSSGPFSNFFGVSMGGSYWAVFPTNLHNIPPRGTLLDPTYPASPTRRSVLLNGKKQR